jgi:hypothetical protein
METVLPEKSAISEIKQIVDDLKSSFDPVKKAAAVRALQNLARTKENRKLIAAFGGINPLIALISDSNEMLRFFAIEELANLANNSVENQNAIREAKGLPPLIACLSDSNERVRFSAIQALANLAHDNTANQDAIRDAQGLKSLIDCLRNENNKLKSSSVIRESIAAALAKLAFKNAKNQDAIRDAEGLPPLIACLKGSRGEERSTASLALATLAYDNTANQEAIREAKGLPPLIACLKDDNINVPGVAAAALANLASNNATNQGAIYGAKGLQPLIDCLSSTRSDIRCFAALAILLLSEEHQANAQALLELNAIDALRACTGDEAKNYAELALAVLVFSGLDDSYPQLKTIKLNLAHIMEALMSRDSHRAIYVAINMLIRMSERKLYQIELQASDVFILMNQLLNDEHPLVRDRAWYALKHFNGQLDQHDSSGEGMAAVSKGPKHAINTDNAGAVSGGNFQGHGGGGGAKEAASLLSLMQQFIDKFLQSQPSDELQQALRESLISFRQSEEHQAFHNKVKSYGLELYDVEHDGNCFFSAVLDQLQDRCKELLQTISQRIEVPVDQITQATLRQLAVGGLMILAERGDELIQSHTANITAYLHNASQDTVWADAIMTSVLCRVLNITIVLLNSDGNAPSILHGGDRGTIYLGYEVQRHFQSTKGMPNERLQLYVSQKTAQPLPANSHIELVAAYAKALASARAPGDMSVPTSAQTPAATQAQALLDLLGPVAQFIDPSTIDLNKLVVKILNKLRFQPFDPKYKDIAHKIIPFFSQRFNAEDYEYTRTFIAQSIDNRQFLSYFLDDFSPLFFVFSGTHLYASLLFSIVVMIKDLGPLAQYIKNNRNDETLFILLESHRRFLIGNYSKQLLELQQRRDALELRFLQPNNSPLSASIGPHIAPSNIEDLLFGDQLSKIKCNIGKLTQTLQLLGGAIKFEELKRLVDSLSKQTSADVGASSSSSSSVAQPVGSSTAAVVPPANTRRNNSASLYGGSSSQKSASAHSGPEKRKAGQVVSGSPRHIGGDANRARLSGQPSGAAGSEQTPPSGAQADDAPFIVDL